jgi:hypothetical protein
LKESYERWKIKKKVVPTVADVVHPYNALDLILLQGIITSKH